MRENDYSDEVARHYAAYRPDLHSLILGQCLEKKTYKKGVDVGCGTGHSAIALTRFCKEVTGLEPNEAMLRAAIDHPQVRYEHLEGSTLPIPSNSTDVITFAGSWFYAQSQDMLNEVNRVISPDGVVIVYDFSICLYPFWFLLGITVPEDLVYDHAINFDGLDTGVLVKTSQHEKNILLQTSSRDLTHLLLADKFVLQSLQGIYKYKDNVYEYLRETVSTDGSHHELNATIYYTSYRNTS
jgi:ubiquinone/menaquinone biosynthesis C-methylase UbiE